MDLTCYFRLFCYEGSRFSKSFCRLRRCCTQATGYQQCQCVCVCTRSEKVLAMRLSSLGRSKYQQNLIVWLHLPFVSAQEDPVSFATP